MSKCIFIYIAHGKYNGYWVFVAQWLPGFTTELKIKIQYKKIEKFKNRFVRFIFMRSVECFQVELIFFVILIECGINLPPTTHIDKIKCKGNVITFQLPQSNGAFPFASTRTVYSGYSPSFLLLSLLHKHFEISYCTILHNLNQALKAHRWKLKMLEVHRETTWSHILQYLPFLSTILFTILYFWNLLSIIISPER